MATLDTVAANENGRLSFGDLTSGGTTQTLVTFSESAQDPVGDSATGDVTNTANYGLFEPGPDGPFQTGVRGPAQSDDQSVTL